MAPRTAPPFRADHVGSLLRPPALLRARAARAAGTITADQLTQAEDDALTLDQQRAKLDLIVETAADLWGS
jgi:5-methyltetrahydropteroyltriglutamate--homocysteine methyltransferase